MAGYDHHHHLIVLSEDAGSGLRSLVGICFGVELPGLKDDPLAPLVDALAFHKNPEWPEHLQDENARLEFLFGDDDQPDQKPTATNTPGTGPSDFGSQAEPPENAPEDAPETMHTLDFTVSLPGPLAGLLPGAQPAKRPKEGVFKRALSRARGLREPEPAPLAERPAVKVRVTAYYGENLVLDPGLPSLIDKILAAKKQDRAEPEEAKESGAAPSASPQGSGSEDGAGPGNEASDAEEPSEDAQSDTASQEPEDEKTGTQDKATPTPPDSLSFMVLHSLAADPVIQSMPVAKKIDLIHDAQIAKSDPTIQFSDVITCCLTDTLIPASRLSTANTIVDATLLLLQERDQQTLWMENAWIDIFGTVFSNEYRSKISSHWERQNPNDHKAMAKLTSADLSLLMVDCDFGGLDVDALEISYIHAMPRNLEKDDVTDSSDERAIQGVARIEHTLFGQSALKLAQMQLGIRNRSVLHDRLKARWRPYRTAAVLLSCLSGNHETAARVWKDLRIACAVYGRHTKASDPSERET